MKDNLKELEEKRQALIEECIERGLPVLGDESIEMLELFLKTDDDDDYFYYDEYTS
jgi:hypothetical protein